ncbi:hypothetical protein SEA_BAZZLE_123 [Mycobacterium phage Bazzle]
MSGTYAPVWDNCAKCGSEITWMAGGLFWMHAQSRSGRETPKNIDHMAEPKRLTQYRNHPTQVERWKRAKARKQQS